MLNTHSELTQKLSSGTSDFACAALLHYYCYTSLLLLRASVSTKLPLSNVVCEKSRIAHTGKLLVSLLFQLRWYSAEIMLCTMFKCSH